MRKSNYDKYPSTHVTNGRIYIGWDAILSELQIKRVLSVDFYTGVLEEEIIEVISGLEPDVLIDTRSLMKAESEILQMTSRFMTDDVLFGYLTNLELKDYFDTDRLEEARKRIREASGRVIVIGTGAAWVTQEIDSLWVYADMARWEIQQRFRHHKVKALGVDNRQDGLSLQYKRGYFNDWRICDQYKESIFHKIDYWLDTHNSEVPKMIDRDTFFKGIDKTVKQPFRVVPFFDPAPWGGQWMKEVCDLDREQANYGWCFDCVPEENSLFFNIDGTLFELPSVDLVLLKARELLGEPVEARFGKDFPIRFDMLDTMGGGNLSLQVHPTTQFIREHFGMYYTQDESYYLLDAEEDAMVYLGLKSGIDKDEMVDELQDAQKGNLVFDAEKYVNKIPARKHDHFLIPSGTIHCSGKDSLVLEISSTPNLFTFKLWDWQRLGLDGIPRPVNVERGAQVIDWERNTDFVNKYLWNHVQTVSSGDGWVEEKTGLHENEFIETRRHWFKKDILHQTNNSVNVLNLVEGEEVIVKSPTNVFEPFTVHYAETFIVPACVGEYLICPADPASGKTYITIKAYVRF